MRHGPAHNHREHPRAAGTERHADADLARAPRDRIGGHAVKPDRGEHQREPAEEGGEPYNKLLLCEVVTNLIRVTPQTDQRYLGVYAVQRLADQRSS